MVRAAIAPLTPHVTEADLTTLTQEVGLALVVRADLHGIACDITEALREYALRHRMDHSEAGAGETEQRARAFADWAAKGLVWLGGTLDGKSPAQDFPLPDSRTAMFLADALPAFGLSFQREDLLHRAAGRKIDDEGCKRPDLHDAIHCCAAALELFQLLGSLLAEKAAARPRETKRTEYARRELMKQLAAAFKRLHDRDLTISRSAGHAKGPNDRDNLPGGRGLRWVRSLLSLISERGSDPEMTALADWAQRPDAVADLLRSPRKKDSGKSPRNTDR